MTRHRLRAWALTTVLALAPAVPAARQSTPAPQSPAPATQAPSAPAPDISAVSSNPVIVENTLRSRIAQGGLSFGVAIALAVACRQAGGPNQIQLGFEASVPLSAPRPLTVLFGVVDTAGRLLNAGRRAVTTPADADDGRLTFTVPVAPGRYRLRVAVADAAGRIGSTETEVVAYLTELGPLRVSDVLTAWARADGQFRFLGLPDPPAGAKSVRVSLELYPDPAQPPPPVTVHFALVGEHDTTPVFAADAKPTGAGPALMASTTIALEKIPPGTYALRASVVNGASVLGTVSRSIVIQ